MRFAISVTALFIALAAQADKPSFATLPVHPHIQAQGEQAEWIERKLHKELRRQGAQLVRGQSVLAAMAKVGAKDALTCDTQCLLKIGRELQVDFVVGPTLSLQKKEQSVGVVWIWKNRLVNVKENREWGIHQRMCMCSSKTWDRIAERQVTRMLQHDPAKVIRLPKDALLAKVTEGPHKEDGMVFVPEGPFVMGYRGGEFDEEPRHLVHLSAYWMDKYEVSNARYNLCVEAGKCRKQRYWYDKTLNQPQHAVVAVGWQDGVNYCAWAGKHLPTEAQWEKAARGTDERIFPWGNDWDVSRVNMHWDKDGYAATAPVDAFPKNVSPYGAYGMSGNAWEWTADYWHPHTYRKSAKRDPTGPETGVKRVMRGGSWLYDVPFFVTTHNRSPGRPWIRKAAVGFRCAKSLKAN